MLKRVIARASLPKSLDVLPLFSFSKKGKGGIEKVAGDSQVKTLVSHPKCVSAHFCNPKDHSETLREDDDGGDVDKHDAVDVPFGFRDAPGNILLDLERRRLFAGIGEKPTVRDYRLAVTAAVREASKLKASALVMRSLPNVLYSVGDLFQPASALPAEDVAEKTVTYAVAAAYRYDRFLSKAKGGLPPPRRGRRNKAVAEGSHEQLNLIIDCGDKTSIASGNIIGHCINDARNLGNLREDEGIPQFYCEWIHQELAPLGIKVQNVLHGEQLEKAGLNLIYNVGKGSKHTPYLVVFEYVGDKRSNKATALVGKGVTFDCGGLNIKPFGSMETMHMDMMGAATVMATMKAIAELQLPVNVVAAVGLAENAIGPSSYHPSCILTSRKGLSVEVLNTDAEGRLVLADTLTYLQKDAKLVKKADTIIDIATLTGAIVVGLGSRRAGLFGNDIALVQQLMASGRSSGEEVWPMPIGDEHQRAIKGNIADLVNVPSVREGGSCTAAAFLSNFVEKDVKWAHLDIAGSGMGTDKPKGFQPAGAPGFGVELLVDYFRQHVMASSKGVSTGKDGSHGDAEESTQEEGANAEVSKENTKRSKTSAGGKKLTKNAEPKEGKGKEAKPNVKGTKGDRKVGEKGTEGKGKAASPAEKKRVKKAPAAKQGRRAVKGNPKGKKRSGN
ncbi:cytosolic leucyl aminopeptidase, putative [Trypanosoma brucei gambiense DAL972]|uniref:Cytosolic leucyl aminopeptidase, putative n=1 Tax=Trypanosoma brucei gambiense (strain MHOM/CI/86/DAL972) TaxID=679716 RepID=C9ZV91_TRYB9|nr:cytosolic leucyl aminopeptidase, putative [Trypanosoma brucei gambiense DAL972]CBH13329.1 cytosolic leucyl aminopeptidase, putative [Trypanosoma brucei gambiense DAL972]|eukprot:XP_011775606.1 cytosolic leucyl aminopeptidase, putative [Trypanosoma brucei gambiense DAL972]